MRLLAPVGFEQVRDVYLHDHPLGRPHRGNTNRDGAENLGRAEERFCCWHAVLLSRADVLGVVLPWHTAEGGAYELVPRSGLTVAETVARLRARSADIAAANPVCAAKLAFLATSPLTPLYLSTQPVPHSDYAGVRPHGALVHLDGLHRMLAWELAERLPPEEALEAFVAGDLGSLRPGDPAAKTAEAAEAIKATEATEAVKAVKEGALGPCSMTP
jgi:hypothetical protein